MVVLVLEVLPVREPRNEDCRINSNDGRVILCGVATQLEDDDEYEDEEENPERTLQVHPETLQVITSWEIFRHWHLP